MDHRLAIYGWDRRYLTQVLDRALQTAVGEYDNFIGKSHCTLVSRLSTTTTLCCRRYPKTIRGFSLDVLEP